VKVVVSPAARADLIEIAAYIARDNPSRALGFVDELETRCLDLGQAPGIGVRRVELGDGVRMVSHGRYLIFYRVHETFVRIERVMHSARDVTGDDLDG